VPELYRRILYDTELEVQAFRCLAELDAAGCRRCLGTLVDQLDLSRTDGDARQVVQLLADILQRLNRRLHRGPGEEAVYQSNRVALIEEFARCEGPEAARRGFLGALNRLLSVLESNRRPPHPQVERAKRFIEEGYWRRTSLSSVAGALHISANYLSRLFRRETGLTLTAYVHQVRLERAMLLLADGSDSISEIAYRVGYQNYRDFYRNFVKYENTSPREFRQRFAERIDVPSGRAHGGRRGRSRPVGRTKAHRTG
jgi:AraC-like DNA-binding protein